MPKYTFTVRKGECELSLVTDDRNAIEQQLAIWVLALSRKPVINAVEPKPYIPEPIDAEQPLPDVPMPEVIEEAKEEPVQEVQSSIPENPEITENNSFDNVENVSENNTEADINNTQVEQMQVESVNALQEPDINNRVEEFVNTLDTKEIFPNVQPAQIQPETAITINNLFNAESPAKVDFESILEHSVESINTESVVKKDEIFCKLVKANNITDRLELLLFTADYFCKYDAKFVFSLKQINGKLMHNLAVIVDHGILKIALDNNYIERAGEGEYRLTEYGRSEIYSKAGIWS